MPYIHYKARQERQEKLKSCERVASEAVIAYMAVFVLWLAATIAFGG